jgi:Membrane domain of glycerophosphoryl diester phosphodiesterase
MYTKPTAPRSIGGVLDGSFSLWMPVLKKTWPLIVIPQLVSFVLAIPQLSKITALTPGQIPSLSGSWASQILSIVCSLVFLGFYTAMVARADDVASNGSMSLGESLRVGFGFWGHAFGLALIMGASMIPVLVPIMLAAAGLQGGQFPSWMLSGGLSLVLFVYVLFLLFLFGRLFLAFVALVLEDHGVGSSIRSSWNLTRGHWWRCAAILTVLTIVTYVVALIGGLVLGIFGLKYGIQRGVFSFPAVIATQLLGLVVGVLFTPLFLGGLLSTYYDLKLRREGGDLEGRVAALGSSKT